MQTTFSIGDFCKPCECNNNINATDPEACNKFSGLCEKCLFNTFGDQCERCEPWYFGDAVILKNCRECQCERKGTEMCSHETGACECFEGVEGEQCERCMPNHWGFDNDVPGCAACNCSEASYSTQCADKTGQFRCKPGVTGQKCDRCMAGYWNLGPDGCESCGCNTEFAVGGTCDQETGQCECLEGVIGQNCDHCPNNWVLVVNETRTEVPEWKEPFDYSEGCFPCSSCVADLMHYTDSLNSSIAPIMREFAGVEAEYFAFRRLNYIESEVDRLQPEIELLNPAEGSRRLEPLEAQVDEKQRRAKSLNVEYKMGIMKDLREQANDMQEKGRKAVDDMTKVGREINKVTQDMREIADGLGSGVTPEQQEASVALGRQWLEDIKMQDFSEERDKARDSRREAADLVEEVNLFKDPVESFKANVTGVNELIVDLKFRLQDLKNHTENTNHMVSKRTKARNSFLKKFFEDVKSTKYSGRIKSFLSSFRFPVTKAL